MTNKREPLWSDIRIRDRYHALVPCEANMGEMEYWNTLRDVGERVSYELRNDYESRIAELEAQLAESREDYRVADNENERLRESKQLLEAQLAQTWQPVGQLKRACTCGDCRNLFGMENEKLLTIADGQDKLSVVLPDNIRLCRLVTKGDDE